MSFSYQVIFSSYALVDRKRVFRVTSFLTWLLSSGEYCMYSKNQVDVMGAKEEGKIKGSACWTVIK